jgi:predicted class III extradiol MEMO1 family dioxygenase
MVPNLSEEQINEYANIFKDYFVREDTIFIISSDFCHWGRK